MLTQEQEQILSLLGTLVPENIALAEQLAIGLQIDIPTLLKNNFFPIIGINTVQDFPKNGVLDLAFKQVGNISAIRWLTGLKEVNLRDTAVSNIEPISSLVMLEELNLQNTQIRNIKAVGACTRLKYLNLYLSKVKDLSPLSSCSLLEDLNLGYNDGMDLSILVNGKFPQMQSLSLWSTGLGKTEIWDIQKNLPKAKIHY